MRSKTHTGIIDTNLEPETSSSGKRYLKFVLKTKETFIACIAFEPLVDEILTNYVPGQPCTILGSGKSGDDGLYVNHFRSGAIETDRIVRLYGSREAYKKYHCEIETEMFKKGYIKLYDSYGGYFAKESRCTYHDGQPRLKIDYCMDILGPLVVEDRCKAAFGKDALRLTDGQFGKQYEAFLEELVNEARQKEESSFI